MANEVFNSVHYSSCSPFIPLISSPRLKRWCWTSERLGPVCNCAPLRATYKHLGLQLYDKLDWSVNTDALDKKR